MNARAGIVLVAAAMFHLVAAGCASSPDSATSRASNGLLPMDLSIEVVIATGPEAPPRNEVHLRPGRWVLLTDGSLTYTAPGPDGGEAVNLTRQLSQREMAGVWTLANQLGLGDPERGDQRINPALIEPPPDGCAWFIAFTADDRRWNFLRSIGADETPDDALATFVRRLGELSWAGELADRQRRVAPKRYFLGADPYARYQQDS